MSEKTNERFYMGGWGSKWTPISKEYFETVIVDFFGRPYGWWHLPMLYENGSVSIIIKPKKHTNHIGLSRINGKFKQVRWGGKAFQSSPKTV